MGRVADERTPRRRRLLLALSLVAPLVRPEGVLVSLLVVCVLLGFPLQTGEAKLSARAPALLALIGPLVGPLLNLSLTGHATSSTTIVKWLPGNPYYGHGAALVAAVRENVRLLFEVLLDGREWSAVYIPTGSRPFAVAALAAIPAAGFLRGRSLRAWLVLGMALSMLIPCTYLTFLWNRLRYLWPFAFAWFVGLACLATCIGELLAVIHPRLRLVGPVMSGLFAASLATHLGWTFDDLVGQLIGDRSPAGRSRALGRRHTRAERKNRSQRHRRHRLLRPSQDVRRGRPHHAGGGTVLGCGGRLALRALRAHLPFRRPTASPRTSSSIRSGWRATRFLATSCTTKPSPIKRSSAEPR